MKEKNGEHPFGDAGQFILLGVFLIVWAGDSFFVKKSIFLSEVVPLYVRLAFLVLALVLAIYLTKSGHVVVAPEKRLSGVVSSGAFRYVRHPLYLASLLFFVGLAVSTASLSSFLVFVFGLVFYDYIASYEEKLMEQKFGDTYLDYKRKTGKWLPKIGGSRK